MVRSNGQDNQEHLLWDYSHLRYHLAFSSIGIDKHPTESLVLMVFDFDWLYDDEDDEMSDPRDVKNLEAAMAVLKKNETLKISDILDYFLPILARKDVMGSVNKTNNPKFQAFFRIDGVAYELTFKKAATPNE